MMTVLTTSFIITLMFLILAFNVGRLLGFSSVLLIFIFIFYIFLFFIFYFYFFFITVVPRHFSASPDVFGSVRPVVGSSLFRIGVGSSVLRICVGSCLKGLAGICPLYGFSRNPFAHLPTTSPDNVPSWYDPLYSFVIQNGPVHRNRNFPGMFPILV